VAAALAVAPDGATPNTIVLSVATSAGLPAAVDLLWIAAPPAEPDIAEPLAELSARVAGYAGVEEHPAWLAQVQDDDAFVTMLIEQSAGFVPIEGAPADGEQARYESLGWNPLDWLRAGKRKVHDAVSDEVGGIASDKLRPALLPGVAKFLGDVLVYLHQQHSREQIADRVTQALVAGHSKRSDADPLVVVGHSMGGNILFDVLSGTQHPELGDVHIDTLVTVGTQVGLFAELGLFDVTHDEAPGQQKLPKPNGVGRWINIYDYSDFLGFRVGPIVDDAADFNYETHSLLHAHGLYFRQPSFHQRLAKRVYPNGVLQ
jgi:hypothetical protein